MKETPKPNPQVRVGEEVLSDDTDTQSLKQLAGFSLESTLDLGTDPYGNDADRSGLRKRRRTLDDMRKLDDEIKRARITKRKGP
jgi:hypothetical protein